MVIQKPSGHTDGLETRPAGTPGGQQDRHQGRVVVASERGVAISQGETEVTFGETPPNIGFVCYWTEQMLTKRRAVDFGRLAASLCPTA